MKKIQDEKQTVIRKVNYEKDGYQYEYTLFVRNSRETASYRLPLYSVSARMTDKDGAVTSHTLNDVFADGGRAIVFFDYVSKNLATPTDLPYVFEDEFVH